MNTDDMDVKVTALNARHRNLKATLIHFAGWQMPLHYGSQLKEHEAVRQDCGMFDISHMLCIDCEGTRATEFLRFLLANDVGKCPVAKGLYTCLLNPQGGVLDDLIVYRLDDTRYRCVVNAATANKDLSWFIEQATVWQVQITPRYDLSILSVQGPKTLEKLQKALDEKTLLLIQPLKKFQVVETPQGTFARTGYTGEDGFEIMLAHQQAITLWDHLLNQGILPIGLGARDSLRLEAGLNLYGDDMDETVTPYESNLGWTVDLKDPNRHFMGKDALLAQLKGGIRQQLVALVLTGAGICRRGMIIYVEQQQGQLTSGGFSPTLKQSIALARIPSGKFTHGEVVIRDKHIPAKIVKLPFVVRRDHV